MQFLFLMALFFLPITPLFAQKSCIDWPRIFAQAQIKKINPQTQTILLHPFVNGSEQEADAWLSDGIADLLGRYLKIHPQTNPIHKKQLEQAGISIKPSYQVSGLFQHTQGWLRLFVQLGDAQGDLLAQFPIETPYPLHQQFFSGLKKTSEGILEKMGFKPASLQAELKAVEQETNVVRAFENFIRGEQALESYDPNRMEVALIWFQEARREDNRFLRIYDGFMDAYGFLSLYHKQNNLPNAADLEGIRQALLSRQQVSRHKKEETISNRFLQAHVHFITGQRAYSNGQEGKAVAELTQAVEQVPEDPLSTYYLSLSYAKLGKAKEAKWWREKALELNRCLNGS